MAITRKVKPKKDDQKADFAIRRRTIFHIEHINRIFLFNCEAFLK